MITIMTIIKNSNIDNYKYIEYSKITNISFIGLHLHNHFFFTHFLPLIGNWRQAIVDYL